MMNPMNSKHGNYRHPRHNEIAWLIQRGENDTFVACELGVSRSAVARVRRILGVAPISKTTPKLSKVARFSHEAEDGHVIWTGRRGHSGTPVIRHLGVEYSVSQVVFEQHSGRKASGQVRPGCDMPQCIAGDHLEDDRDRTQVRLMQRLVAGLGPMPMVCPNGHSQEAEGRIGKDLHWYCKACNTARQQASRKARREMKEDAS